MLIENQTPETSFADEMMKEVGYSAGTPAAPQEKPLDKPEDKPDDEPADKPEDKPADKPADKPEDKPTDKPATPDDSDIDDERLLAALRKKTGRDFKSFEDFSSDKKEPTEQEKKQAAEQVRTEAIAFGTHNKLFTQSEYDNFLVFQSKDPADVVQENFVEGVMKDNASMTKEDAEDLFNELYHTGEDEDSYKYKQAQKLISRQYNDIKTEQFGKIAGVEDTYQNYKKHEGQAKAYSSQVEKIFTEKLPSKFDFTIDGEQVSYPVDLKNKDVVKIINTIKADYLTVDMMNSTVDQTGKLDEGVIMTEIKKDIASALLTKMVAEVAKSYSDSRLVKAKLGRRGMIQLDEETASGASTFTEPSGFSDQLLAEAGYAVGKEAK
jgi:hypothetical protein